MKKPVLPSSVGKISVKKIRLPKPGMMAPDLASLEDPGDFNSPFDPSPEASEGLQADADGEVSAALQSILDERAVARDKYRLTNDQDYYFLVCFQSTQQKLEFLDKTGWPTHEDRLVNGLELAELLGFHIERIDLPMRDYSKPMPVNLRGKEVLR